MAKETPKRFYKWFLATSYDAYTPDAPGVYAIYTVDFFGDKTWRLLYVGTAKNLYMRLKRHEVIKVLRCLTDHFIMIKCKVIEDESRRLNTEAQLIKRLNPPVNQRFELCH